MGRVLIPPRLLRRVGLGLGLGALVSTIGAAQPAPPAAPVPAEAPAAPTAKAAPEAAAAPTVVAPTAPAAAVKPDALAAAPRPTVVDKPVEVVTRRSRYDIAVLQALDKVTAETLRFEARVGRPVRWKGLIFTVGACERSAPEEQIDDSIVYLTIDAQPRPQPGRVTPPPKQAFKGWMYASSPALNPVQHATYDAWAISCRASAPPIVAAPARPAVKPAEPKLLDIPAPPASPPASPPARAPEAGPRPPAEPAPKAAPTP